MRGAAGGKTPHLGTQQGCGLEAGVGRRHKASAVHNHRRVEGALHESDDVVKRGRAVRRCERPLRHVEAERAVVGRRQEVGEGIEDAVIELREVVGAGCQVVVERVDAGCGGGASSMPRGALS